MVLKVIAGIVLVSCALGIVYLSAEKINVTTWPILLLMVLSIIMISADSIHNFLAAVIAYAEHEGITVVLAVVAATVLSALSLYFSDSRPEKQRISELLASAFIGFVLGANIDRIRRDRGRPPEQTL